MPDHARLQISAQSRAVQCSVGLCTTQASIEVKSLTEVITSIGSHVAAQCTSVCLGAGVPVWLVQVQYGGDASLAVV